MPDLGRRSEASQIMPIHLNFERHIQYVELPNFGIPIVRGQLVPLVQRSPSEEQ
jgi:hypothetical protein